MPSRAYLDTVVAIAVENKNTLHPRCVMIPNARIRVVLLELYLPLPYTATFHTRQLSGIQGVVYHPRRLLFLSVYETLHRDRSKSTKVSSLISALYSDTMGGFDRGVPTARPVQDLQRFGGPLTIEEYRKDFQPVKQPLVHQAPPVNTARKVLTTTVTPTERIRTAKKMPAPTLKVRKHRSEDSGVTHKDMLSLMGISVCSSTPDEGSDPSQRAHPA